MGKYSTWQEEQVCLLGRTKKRRLRSSVCWRFSNLWRVRDDRKQSRLSLRLQQKKKLWLNTLKLPRIKIAGQPAWPTGESIHKDII